MRKSRIVLRLASMAVLAAATVISIPARLHAQTTQTASDDISADDIRAGKWPVTHYDDRWAQIECSVSGDRGSMSITRITLDGLYVLRELNRTRLTLLNMPNVAEQVQDVFFVFPQKLRVTSSGTVLEESTTGSHPKKGTHERFSFTWGQDRSTTFPAPPAKGASQAELMRWQESIREKARQEGIGGGFLITDLRDRGQGLTIHPSGGILTEEHCERSRWFHSWQTDPPPVGYHEFYRTETSYQTCQMIVGPWPGRVPHYNAPPMRDTDDQVSFFIACRPPMIGHLDTIDLTRLSFSRVARLDGVPHYYKQMTQLAARDPELNLQAHSDSRCFATVRYSLGLKKTVDATLEPADSGEQDYLPTPGDVREYTLTIEEPQEIENIEAVRFVLDDVSRHEGLATNAGCHLLYDGDCPHCSASSDEQYTVAATYHGYTITRSYRGYNDCPIDSLPDLYFTDADNPDFELGQDAISEGLNYSISHELTLEGEEVDRLQFNVKVRIMDAAAAGRLRAEVRVAGMWYDAKATGPTARRTGDDLLIPLDEDWDGIADRWQDEHNAKAERDGDVSANLDSIGDGLTDLEEYRGVYEVGEHKRLEPERHDLFVYDYSGRFAGQLGLLRMYYEREGIDLHVVTSREMRNDIINCRSASTKQGSQYVIVVMDFGTQMTGTDGNTVDAVDCLDTAMGRASHVGPPTSSAHTVILKSEYSDPLRLAGILGHEIGHNINCPHHGEKDRFVDIPDGTEIDGQPFEAGKYMVAVKGGKRSGCIDCFMRYLYANLYCDTDHVVLPVEDNTGMYHIFPESASGTHERFCTNSLGTGANADQQVAGDATVGNCKKHITIKSY